MVKKKSKTSTQKKSAPQKKAVVSRSTGKKAIKKSTSSALKKKTIKKSATTSSTKKKVVKKSSAASATKKRPAPLKEKPSSPQKQQDIDALTRINADLDMMTFKYVSLDGKVVDLIYSSDRVAILCEIISDEHNWTVDTTKPIKSNFWKDETGAKQNFCAEILNQAAILKKMEPEAQVIPTLVLMRGSIKNEAKVLAYLAKNNIRLVRCSTNSKSNAQSLMQLLTDKFSFGLEDEIGLEDEDIIQKEAQIASAKSSFSDKVCTSSKSPKEKLSLASLATLGPIGYFPKGPGTIGSLVALPIAYAVGRPALWFLTLILLVIGLLSIHQFTANKKEKDPSCVIIDEVVGQLITFFIVIPNFMHWPALLLGFLLFRFFDIFKFGPVAFFDRKKILLV